MRPQDKELAASLTNQINDGTADDPVCAEQSLAKLIACSVAEEYGTAREILDVIPERIRICPVRREMFLDLVRGYLDGYPSARYLGIAEKQALIRQMIESARHAADARLKRIGTGIGDPEILEELAASAHRRDREDAIREQKEVDRRIAEAPPESSYGEPVSRGMMFGFHRTITA